MPTLYVEAKTVVSPTSGNSAAGHLYLVYKTDDGTEYVLRAGPLNDNPANWGRIEVFHGLLADSEDTRTKSGYEQSPEYRGQRALLSGQEATDAWLIMNSYAVTINSANIPYSTLPPGVIQNSNSFVYNLLMLVGIDVNVNMPTPGFYPGQGFPGSTTDFGIDHLVIGSDRGDTLIGGAGAQQIHGYGGNDVVSGGAGNDVLDGDDGNDILDGGAHNDVIRGGDGTDLIFGSVGTDTVYGGSGHDSLDFRNIAAGVTIYPGFAFFDGGFTTFSEIEEVHGSLLDDEMHLDMPSIARVDGRGGDDRIYVASDTLPFVEGGSGYDTLYLIGSPVTLATNLGKVSGVEAIVNTAGDDVMLALPGMTYLTGGGSDRYVITSGATIYGASVLDYTLSSGVTVNMTTLVDSHGNAFWNYGSRIQTIIGSSGDDVLSLDLSSRDPAFVAAGGGEDTLAMSGANGGAFSFHMGTGVFADQYGSATGLYTGFENFDAQNSAASFTVFGSDGSDVIHTGTSASVVHGGGGTDFIFGHADTRFAYDGLDGGDGDDVIVGFGRDNLFGGEGDDVITMMGSYGVRISDGPGHDVVRGGSGDDLIFADGSGGDLFSGGGGTDMVFYPFATSGSSAGRLIAIERGGAGWDVTYEIAGQQRVDQLAADVEYVMFSNGSGGFGGWPLTGDFGWHV